MSTVFHIALVAAIYVIGRVAIALMAERIFWHTRHWDVIMAVFTREVDND